MLRKERKMKKLLVLLLALLLCFVFISCGSDTGSSDNDGSTDATSDVEESTSEETEDNSDLLFHDNIYEDDDIKIEILKYEVIQPGDTTYSEYNFEDKPVIAFWYNTTNKSGEDVDPSSAWILKFTAIQDNDPNMVNELEVSSLPDDTYLDTQMASIKEGGTLESCVGYVLDDEETPVVLQVKDWFSDKDLGSQTFEIKQ